MGRTVNKGLEPTQDAPLSGDVLTQNQNQASQHSELILAQFGDGMPYDRLRYLDRARFHMARSAEEALAVGRCLIVMKENEPHGEWLGILGQLGIEPRLAQRMAQASLKFSGAEAPTQLIEAAKSKTKLFELMVLDDEELQVLNEGGTVAGLELDDVDRMSSKELRAALREAREDKKAQGRLMAEKNDRIDSLTSDLEKVKRHVQTLKPDQVAKALRQEVVAIAFEAEADIAGKLREGFTKLAEHAEEHGADHRTFMGGALRQLETMIVTLRQEFHLPEDLDPEAAPDWLTSDPDKMPVGAHGA